MVAATSVVVAVSSVARAGAMGAAAIISATMRVANGLRRVMRVIASPFGLGWGLA